MSVKPSAAVHRSYGNDRKTIAVRFFPDSTTDPTFVGDYEIASVTRDGTGVYTVTCRSSHSKVLGVSVCLGLGTPALHAVVAEIDNDGTGAPLEVQVTRLDAEGNAADDTADADTWISLVVEVEDG